MGVLRDKWERKALGYTTEAHDLQLCRGVVTDPATEKAIEYMWRSAASRHMPRFFYLSKKRFEDDKLSPNLVRIAQRAQEKEVEERARRRRELRKQVHEKALAEASMREGHDPTEWGHAGSSGEKEQGGVGGAMTRTRSVVTDEEAATRADPRATLAGGGGGGETAASANAAMNTPGPRGANGAAVVHQQRPPVRWRWSKQRWEDPAHAALREHGLRHLPARTAAKHGPAVLPCIGPPAEEGAARGGGALGRRSVAGDPEWVRRVRVHEQAREELSRSRADPRAAEEQRQRELMLFYQQEHQRELRARDKKKGVQGLLARAETPQRTAPMGGHRSKLSVRMSG